MQQFEKYEQENYERFQRRGGYDNTGGLIFSDMSGLYARWKSELQQILSMFKNERSIVIDRILEGVVRASVSSERVATFLDDNQDSSMRINEMSRYLLSQLLHLFRIDDPRKLEPYYSEYYQYRTKFVNDGTRTRQKKVESTIDPAGFRTQELRSRYKENTREDYLRTIVQAE